MTKSIVNLWKNSKGYICLTLEDGTIEYLHRFMWKIYHPSREIPIGWDIHHADGNYYNLDIDNLWCLPRKLHNLLEKNRRKLKRSIKSRLNILLHPPKSASILYRVCDRMIKSTIDTGFSVSIPKSRETYIRGW